MANSKFILTFTEMPNINDVLRISESSLSLNLIETFRNSRLAMFQTKIPQQFDVGTPEEPDLIYSGNISENYKNAFNLDYNSTGLFTVTNINYGTGSGFGAVTVEANFAGAVFLVVTNTAGVGVEIINEEASEGITIDSVVFSEADATPCQLAKCSIETSVLATKVTASIPITTPTEPSSNFALYSNDMSNAVWEKIRAITSGTKFIPNNVSGTHGIRQIVSKEAVAGNYTFSFYAKAAELNIVDFIALRTTGSGSAWSAFNLTTGEVFYAYGVADITYISHSLTDVGNGYYRFAITLGLPADNDISYNVRLRSAAGESTFTGNNSDGLYLERFQFNKLGVLPYLETTNQPLEVGYSDGTVIEPNEDNPIEFDILRGQVFSVTVENADGNQATQTIQVPSALNPDNFTVQINNSPNGATVIVNIQNTNALVLEYSLDGTSWQSENVFSGLETGSYTLFVKDQLGCAFFKEFVVSESGLNVPHFYISKSNSFRFAQRITFGTSQNYKTDENTLSCEVEVGIPYHEVQLFNTSDIITTQFQSNYQSNVFRIKKADGTYDTIPVLQKTNFTNIRDKRDARKYDLGDGKTGIYFLNGNIYNYDTNAATGTHALNGLVPQWAIPGNYINLSGSWFIIERVIFDESKNADVIVISQIYSGVDSAVVVGCIYNIYPYEIYEATVDMGDYINQSIRAELVCSGSSFPTITHLSEQIDVATSHEFTLDINYWNDDNNDVYYASGIRHRIRVLYTKIEGVPDGESSIHKTDTSAILLNASMYEGKKFIFEPVTEEIWRKLMMALSHKNVFINGVKYVKDGDFETEGPLEDSNLYVLKATMLKDGGVYNSDGSTFGAGNASNAEIPGFIEGNDGFISY